MNDLKDALSRVADSSAAAPLSLEHVRGRARQIRRRRTTTAIVGSAAAVAVIAGVGVAFLPSDGGNGSIAPATRTPSVTPSATPSVAADPDATGPVFAVTSRVPAEQTSGAEPGVPYWSDGRIVDTDGTATPLPDRPFTFAKDTENGGWVVIRAAEAHAELVHLGVDGRQVGPVRPTFEAGLAVGADGAVASLTEEADGWQLHVAGRDLPLQRSSGPVEGAQIDGILPSGDVVVQVDGRVEVHTLSGDIRDLSGAAAAAASPTVPFVAIGGEDGIWRAQENGGRTLWSVDWAGVNAFSPDGRYVVLVGDPKHRLPASTDWDSAHATSTLWIRDAQTLAPVAAFTAPENGYFWSWAWAGDELVATLYDRGTGEWSLVRLGADGFTVGRATGRPGGGEEPAYVFAAS